MRPIDSTLPACCRLVLVVSRRFSTEKADQSELVSGIVVFADQAFVSATNFMLAAAIVRFFDFEQIGLFALGAAYSRFAVELARALLSEPLLLLQSRSSNASMYLRPSLVLHLLAGLTFALPLFAVGVLGVLKNWELGPTVMAFAFVLPVLACHDSMRFVSFATDRGVAARADSLMLIVAMVSLVFVPRSMPLLVLGWGCAAGAALAVGTILLRDNSASPFSTQKYRRLVGRRGLYFLLEAIVERGLGQVTVFAVAGLVGVAASGQIHSGRLVFGLVNIALIGLSPALTPTLVARAASKTSMVPPLAAAGIGSTAAVGLVTLFACVDPWGLLSGVLQPATYLGVRPLLPWIGLGIWFGVGTLLLVTYYRVADLISKSTTIRIGVNISVLVGAVVGASTVGGAIGVVAGMTLARGVFVSITLFTVFPCGPKSSRYGLEDALDLTSKALPRVEGVRSAP